MVFKVLMSCLCCLMVLSPAQSEETYEWVSKPYGIERPGPRTGFVCAHDYDHFDTKHAINDLIVYGGTGPNGTPMDRDGEIWIQKLHDETAEWDKMVPLSRGVIPPARHQTSGVLFPVLHRELESSAQYIKRFRNLITFGGAIGSTVDDGMWVCAQIYCKISVFGREQFWEWIEADQTGDLPEARLAHRMAFIPAGIIDAHGYVFLLGGKDGSSNPITDAYLGELTYSITDSSSSDPWEYTISIDCDWEDLTLAESDIEDIGLTGESVVFDPYYGAHPRILIYGGYDENGDVTDALVEFDLTTMEWSGITPINAGPDARAEHACALDIREHRLFIHGGKDTNGVVLNDVAYLDLRTNAWTIDLSSGRPYRYGHAGAYYWMTVFGGISSNGDYMDDTWEYKPLDSGKTWEIEPDGEYGLDDPAGVINTPRIKAGDIVRIHSGESGHYYSTQCVIPSYVGHFTIEGVIHEGTKPVLAQPYTVSTPIPKFADYEQSGEDLEDSITTFFFANDNGFVIRDGCGISIRNLKICHYQQTPDDEIPGTILDQYEEITNSNDLLMADPGIVMHGPTEMEGCEFESNIVGATLICVSSVPGSQEARITASSFYHNFVGAVVLETSHDFSFNTLESNYLAGIVMEKGAHGRIVDNVFIGNGSHAECPVEWRCGLLSSFDIVSGVPYIQTPLIVNNTFVNNYHALSITEAVPSRQYLNMPVLWNNIIYKPTQGTECAVYLTDVDRCRMRSGNTLYDCDEKWLSETDGSLQSIGDIPDDDPVFASVSLGNYKLSVLSPCINAGITSLEPGIMSEGEYSDYHLLDAGCHFSNVSSAMGPITNLTSDELQLNWSAPTGYTVQGYLIIWEDTTGFIYGSERISSTTYEISGDLAGLGLWFGVSAFSSSGQFGQPVFIQM